MATSPTAGITATAKPLKPGAASGDIARQKLQKLVQGGGPNGEAAAELLRQLDANPALANDPNFRTQTANLEASSIAAGLTGQGVDFGTLNGAGQGQQIAAPAAAVMQAKATAKSGDVTKQIQGGAESNKKFVDTNITPLLGTQDAARIEANRADQEALTGQKAARDSAAQREQGIVQQTRDLANSTNAASSGMYNDYAAGQGALNTQDQGSLSRYLSETDPLMSQLQARGSDPADIQRQLSSYNQLQGVAGGSLDYQAAEAQLERAALSQYGSNPRDIQRQQDSYDTFGGIGGGSLDYESKAAQAFADPNDVRNQRQALGDIQTDLRTGDKEQRESLDLIKSRTGNTATAEEAYLAEVLRRKFENDDRGSREAQMADLAQRGLRSGSAEIAGQLAEREQISQDRTLGELGLQANAMQRARAYTGMQADQSNAMRGSQQNALGMQGNLATALRNASFDEEFKRGIGADTASANNQGTQLSGYQLQGNQANEMRNANDRVGLANTGWANENSQFNAGQANQTSQFNAGQTNNARANNQGTRLSGTLGAANQSNQIRTANDAMSQFQDTYASNEATRVGNLAGQRNTQSLATTGQVGTRNNTTHTAGQNVIADNSSRSQGAIDKEGSFIQPDYLRDSDVNSMTGAAGERAFGRVGQQIGGGATIAGVQGIAQNDLVAALKFGLGTDAYNKDEEAFTRGY
jgi:hypothetical protein